MNHWGKSRRNQVAGAVLWMLVVGALTFFVPILNGLIAGLVGGHKAKTFERALLASVPAAALVGALTAIVLSHERAPVLFPDLPLSDASQTLLTAVFVLGGACAGGLLAELRGSSSAPRGASQ